MKEKDFEGWFAHQLDLENQKPPYRGFEEGEIWRCTLGHNVGHEIDGRSKRYWRPVLVLRKFSPTHLLGAPLTSSANRRPFHIPVRPVGMRKSGYVVIDQVRALDARRLRQLMGHVTPEDFERIRGAVIEMLEKASADMSSYNDGQRPQDVLDRASNAEHGSDTRLHREASRRNPESRRD